MKNKIKDIKNKTSEILSNIDNKIEAKKLAFELLIESEDITNKLKSNLKDVKKFFKNNEESIVCYSFNDGYWYTNKYEFHEILKSKTDVSNVCIGEAIFYQHSELIDGDVILGAIQHYVYDNYGESSGTYLQQYMPEEKLKELESLVTSWMNKNVKKPEFFKVFNVKVMPVEQYIQIKDYEWDKC